MKEVNYIISLVLICVALYYLCIGDIEWAIWFGVLSLNSLIQCGLGKIDDLIKKIDELKNK